MTLDLIKQTVGHYFNINLEDETNNKSRKRDNVESRMVYFHLSRFFTKKSLGDLGRSIKPHKDHSTVLHNIVQTENLLAFGLFRHKISLARKQIKPKIWLAFCENIKPKKLFDFYFM